MNEMKEEDHNHLESIATRFTNRLRRKYEKGKLEHGGELWRKKRLIEMAIDESVDLPTYLYSLKDQLDNLHCENCGTKIELGEIDE